MKDYFFIVIIALVSTLYSPGITIGHVQHSMDQENTITDETSRIYVDDTQYQCLALAVYYEARNQPLQGQAAVAMVVLNRAEDDFWPSNICDVVKQGSYSTGKVQKNQCQFSWYCDGRPNNPTEHETWNEIQSFVRHVFYAWNVGYDVSYGATNFHNTRARPRWRHDPDMQHVATIGDHIFYHWNRPNNVVSF